MSAASLSTHDQVAIRAKGRRIVTGLIAAALDPSAPLASTDRIALRGLARAVAAEIASRIGPDGRSRVILPVQL